MPPPSHVLMHVDAQPTAVQAHLEAEVMTVRRELSAEYRRRLDALEAEWATRASSRASELETVYTLNLQQVRCRASCRTSTTKAVCGHAYGGCAAPCLHVT